MSLRESMPETAAFIDAMRDAFGKDEINGAIRKGMAGLPGHFYASENGNEIGTKAEAPGACFTVDELWLSPKKGRK